jgi:flagellar biogenesis protein FliO
VSQRTRKIAGLCIVLVFAGGWAALAARSADEPDKAIATPQKGLSFLSDPNLAGVTEMDLGNRELFARMALSVVLVVVLGAAVLYVSKTVLPKVAKRPGKEIHIIETAYLGPRKALHLVEVGSQKLLIASTNENVTTLAHVTDGWVNLSKQGIDDMVKV